MPHSADLKTATDRAKAGDGHAPESISERCGEHAYRNEGGADHHVGKVVQHRSYLSICTHTTTVRVCSLHEV